MRYIIGFLCCSMFSLSSFAATQVTERKHNLGVVLGVGMANTQDERESDDAVSHMGVYYEYKLDNRYSVHMTALDGASQCLILCNDSDTYVNYTSYQLSLKAATHFSGRWNLFGRAGADFYRVEYRQGTYHWGDDPKTISGADIALALGGQFRTKNGFSLNIEYQYLPIKQGDLRTASVSVGYAF